MPKRRLTSIRLDKIAAVDKPCQQHATVAIVKRAPDGPALPAIAKRTFEEALHAQLVSEKISETFWRAFENQWAVREAFRDALTDEVAEGGDGTKATEGFTAAMRELATLAAEAAREAAGTTDTDLESAVEEAISKWLNQQEQETMKITTKAMLKSAVAAFNPETSPAAHITIIRKAATDLNAEDELPAEGLLAKAEPATDVSKLEREIALLKMAPDVRKHFDALPEADQPAFLAKSETDRAAIVAKANETDPVEYTTKSGVEVRKSAGATALALAKQFDAQADELAKLRGEVGETGLAKRAEAYPNVAAKVAIDMLKSVDQVGAGTDAGKAMLASLDRMNKAQGGLFKSLGDDGKGDVAESGDATAKAAYDAKTAEIAKRDSIPLSAAMTKVRVEAPDIFKAAFPASAEAEEEEPAAA